MRKVLLSLALAGSLFAATEVELDAVKQQQSVINQQQSEINLNQEKINDNQIDTNKQNREELDNVKSQFSSLKNLVHQTQSNNSGSTNRYTDEKLNRLDDKIYRLERTLSDQDSRIRKLEMKVR